MKQEALGTVDEHDVRARVRSGGDEPAGCSELGRLFEGHREGRISACEVERCSAGRDRSEPEVGGEIEQRCRARFVDHRPRGIDGDRERQVRNAKM